MLSLLRGVPSTKAPIHSQQPKEDSHVEELPKHLKDIFNAAMEKVKANPQDIGKIIGKELYDNSFLDHDTVALFAQKFNLISKESSVIDSSQATQLGSLFAELKYDNTIPIREFIRDCNLVGNETGVIVKFLEAAKIQDPVKLVAAMNMFLPEQRNRVNDIIRFIAATKMDVTVDNLLIFIKEAQIKEPTILGAVMERFLPEQKNSAELVIQFVSDTMMDVNLTNLSSFIKAAQIKEPTILGALMERFLPEQKNSVEGVMRFIYATKMDVTVDNLLIFIKAAQINDTNLISKLMNNKKISTGDFVSTLSKVSKVYKNSEKGNKVINAGDQGNSYIEDGDL